MKLTEIVAIATNRHPDYIWSAGNSDNMDAVHLTGCTKPLTDRFGETLHMTGLISGLHLFDYGDDAVVELADKLALHLEAGL